MSKKALFLDLDGTLLNDEREITAGNRAAIMEALQAGHKVIITTGRPLTSALVQADQLGLPKEGCYIIAFNGGMIYDLGAGKVVGQQTIPGRITQEVFAEAGRRGIHLQAYDEKQVVVDRKHNQDYVERYCKKILMEHRQVDSIADLEGETCKMLAIDYRERGPLQDFMVWINTHYAGQLTTFFSCQEYVEIIPHGLGKGNALTTLSGYLGISLENTISAGDEENDLSMIQAAGIGCAMANAIPKAKDIADYVTVNDNNHDGIREIIEKFML